MSPTTQGQSGRVCVEPAMWGTTEGPGYTATRPRPGACSPAASPCPQEGVTSQTSHWSRLYFMTFYIVTMVGPRPQHALRPSPFTSESPAAPAAWWQPGEEGPGRATGIDGLC